MWPRQNPRMHLKGLFREVIADIFNILGSVTAAGFTWFYNWIQYFLTNRPQTGWVLPPSHLPSPSHKAVQFSAHFKARRWWCLLQSCKLYNVHDIWCNLSQPTAFFKSYNEEDRPAFEKYNYYHPPFWMQDSPGVLKAAGGAAMKGSLV